MTSRPWRLTRRQRVEMEAALSTMRLSAWARYLDPRDLHRAMMRLGCALEAAPGIEADTPFDEVRRIEGAWWRILRARVAIALRAALRADEDARCEEAFARSRHGIETDAMREWPDLDRGWYDRVPLALWARKPSLRAQSPPTSGGPKHGW